MFSVTDRDSTDGIWNAKQMVTRIASHSYTETHRSPRSFSVPCYFPFRGAVLRICDREEKQTGWLGSQGGFGVMAASFLFLSFSFCSHLRSRLRRRFRFSLLSFVAARSGSSHHCLSVRVEESTPSVCLSMGGGCMQPRHDATVYIVQRTAGKAIVRIGLLLGLSAGCVVLALWLCSVLCLLHSVLPQFSSPSSSHSSPHVLMSSCPCPQRYEYSPIQLPRPYPRPSPVTTRKAPYHDAPPLTDSPRP